MADDAHAFGVAFQNLLKQAVSEAIAEDAAIVGLKADIGSLKADMRDVKAELKRLADGLGATNDDVQFMARALISEVEEELAAQRQTSDE